MIPAFTTYMDIVTVTGLDRKKAYDTIRTLTLF